MENHEAKSIVYYESAIFRADDLIVVKDLGLVHFLSFVKDLPRAITVRRVS